MDTSSLEGTHPMEIDGAVSFHHVWSLPPPAAPIIKRDRNQAGQRIWLQKVGSEIFGRRWPKLSAVMLSMRRSTPEDMLDSGEDDGQTAQNFKMADASHEAEQAAAQRLK